VKITFQSVLPLALIIQYELSWIPTQAFIIDPEPKLIFFQEAKYQFQIITISLLLPSISQIESIISIDLETYFQRVFQEAVLTSLTSYSQTLICRLYEFIAY
jgi:hypothetical protein